MVVKIYNNYSENINTDLLNKKIHVVCKARNGLTVYGSYLTAVCNVNKAEAVKYADTINFKNETGTLYPKHNISAVPVSIYNQRNDFGNREIMKKHILDCFLANEQYIKCGDLIFDLDNYDNDFDLDLAYQVLKEEAKIYSFNFTKNIYLVEKNVN